MSTPTKQWITLNDSTIPIASIQCIDMTMETTMEKSEYYFIVHCTNQSIHKVNLYSTGGKWLYTVCKDGLEEAKRGGERYERL
jgi:hypothetical protein